MNFFTDYYRGSTVCHFCQISGQVDGGNIFRCTSVGNVRKDGAEKLLPTNDACIRVAVLPPETYVSSFFEIRTLVPNLPTQLSAQPWYQG